MALRTSVKSKYQLNESSSPPTPQTLLVVNLPMQNFVGAYSQDVWYAWAQNDIHPKTFDAWFKYQPDWRTPAPVRNHKLGVEENKTTFFLEMARTPAGEQEDIVPGTVGVVGKSYKYVKTENKGMDLAPGVWYKAISKPHPSLTALGRAMRLWLLSNVLGRKLLSTKDITAAEFVALREWLFPVGDITNIKPASRKVFRALIQDAKFRRMLRGQPRPETV
jgi:hypothetical protein